MFDMCLSSLTVANWRRIDTKLWSDFPHDWRISSIALNRQNIYLITDCNQVIDTHRHKLQE